MAGWPGDADGDVFRRLAAHGFDFSRRYTVDYNVDFDSWPPDRAAIDLLESLHGPVAVYEPDDDGYGYIQFKIHDLVKYEYVTAVQRQVSIAMKQYGGVCESWGVMHEG